MAVKTEASLEPGDSAAMAGLGMVKKKKSPESLVWTCTPCYN